MVTATHCPYCSLQCGVDVDGIAVSGREFPTNRGGLCRKGATAGALLRHPDRLTTPLARDHKGAALGPVSWDEALDRVAAAILRTQAPFQPAGKHPPHVGRSHRIRTQPMKPPTPRSLRPIRVWPGAHQPISIRRPPAQEPALLHRLRPHRRQRPVPRPHHLAFRLRSSARCAGSTGPSASGSHT